MKELDEIIQENEVPRTDPIDHGIIHHNAEGHDEEHTHAQQARRKEAQAPQKILAFFYSFYAVFFHKHTCFERNCACIQIALYTMGKPLARQGLSILRNPKQS